MTAITKPSLSTAGQSVTDKSRRLWQEALAPPLRGTPE